MAKKLAARDLHTVEDLIWLVPRRYDDVRLVTPLGAAITAAARDRDPDPDVGARARTTTFGVTLSSRYQRRGRRGWVDLRLAGTDDTASRLLVRFFNAHPSLAKRTPRGSRVVLSGKLERRTVGAEMTNPDILSITLPGGVVDQRQADIIPRYSDVAGVAPATLRKAIAAAVADGARHVADGVPAAVIARLGMVSLAEALSALHAPAPTLSVDEVESLNRGDSVWHRRLAFDELFTLGLAVAIRRRARRADHAAPCPLPVNTATEPASGAGPEPAAAALLPPLPAALSGALGRALPWQLTGAQRRAVTTISADLARDVPMNRLLQGDVGSGKTAVAFAALWQAVQAGKQVAFMAPTAILAEQHAATLLPWCNALGVRATLLTAATPRATRQDILGLLGDKQLDLLIGTHALLSEGVEFADLGLVIIDEQHRFGVAQRFDLRAKGEGDEPGVPHLLVMTATPIPRTLALTAYGDLDVTTIDELPPGRQPTKTLVLSGASGRERAYALVQRCLDAGERIYVVCPLIEPPESPGDGPPRADAIGTAERLSQTFAPARVGLVHGRMPQRERDDVMDRFRRGEVDILVATTVIEVGVDVPEATVMVIVDAHGFGLAQLHQLRGRVGRGGGASHCLLMTRGRKTPEGRRRLEIMAETSDGFRIAEEDLRLRGPGELIGVRQSGLPRLRFGDLREHGALLVQARDAAEAVIAADPKLERPEHRGVRQVLRQRTRDAALYGAESG